MDIKSSLGFGKYGYITIFKNVKKEYDDWIKGLPARYSKYWGWYLPEGDTIGSLPFGVEAVRLEWDQISNGDELKSEKELYEVVDGLRYARDGSIYLGKEGEPIQVVAKVVRAVPIVTDYGNKTLYTMDDTHGNHLTWATTETMKIGDVYIFDGIVAKHKLFRNCCQTSLRKVKKQNVYED